MSFAPSIGLCLLYLILLHLLQVIVDKNRELRPIKIVNSDHMTNKTNYSFDPVEYLRHINDEAAISLLPATVYVACLLVIGFLGNAAVLHFYRRKTRKSINNLSICFLACCDLLVCCVAMPSEIIDLTLPYMFESSAACKSFEFIHHFSSVLSGLTLLVIAVNRYLRVCRPFGNQMRKKHFVIACSVSVLVSALLSCPTIPLYGAQTINATHSSGATSLGFDCTFTTNKHYASYIWIFNAFQIAVFLLVTASLFVLYFLVARAVLKYKKFHNRCTKKQLSISLLKRPLKTLRRLRMSSEDRTQTSVVDKLSYLKDGGENDGQISTNNVKGSSNTNLNVFLERSNVKERDQIHLDHGEVIRFSSSDDKDNFKTCVDATQEQHGVSASKSSRGIDNNAADIEVVANESLKDEATVSSVSAVDSKLSCSVSTDKSFEFENQRLHISKYTFIMFIVTLVFILSFLPYFGASIWRNVGRDRETELSFGIQIALRSYLVNSATNPIIYGMFNTSFRIFLKAFISCKGKTVSIHKREFRFLKYRHPLRTGNPLSG